MAAEILSQLVVLVLAIALGFELISRVPTLLHTPLMSATNAIHGIVVVGALVIVLTAEDTLTKVLGLVAVFFGAVNVVGGFIVTNRMLEMFRGGSRRKRG
ncbi:MAG: NAD(P) transhydrogenase subunit alpha [Thermoleophilaceae bacterium]|nr:NAD(P) transhydrogenase subunit alpha [Thermoleophilaceae bacterium]MDQ3240981.1 NAD(P) transhydrogenase subunit alpha [Actinomycetota bacterium]